MDPSFVHPLAGRQLVKGTVDQGEEPENAAAREFLEETGRHPPKLRYLGAANSIIPGEKWFCFSGQVIGWPEGWSHWCQDDGGHLFDFFWWPIDKPLDHSWDARFRRAVEWVKDRF